MDSYLEYEPNLKLLQFMLCKPQVYRHTFFNKVDSGTTGASSKSAAEGVKTAVFTALYLVVGYWYRNRQKHTSEEKTSDFINQIPVDLPGMEITEENVEKLVN